ncbi:type I phosphomannose isomerase catalytic subunit [Mucilaginibacter gilvus]|uniref:Mannose-6-phosphate isomerase n=1 Tax=Mucilaginibacter gilvus TaxID=2305909 RepID=A0A444MNL0_9SPHI|nr:type I phosphomannose isomerase catalytic subunit [Mucilaginibacter gilvus]RWY51625.1 mannose-6-phosphate isomerase [Mucilaginibacter gilvus]
MNQFNYYPLRFTPIYQYRLWGGRNLADFLSEPLPDGPVGEAWLLSDRDDHPSLVADGDLSGQSLVELFKTDEAGLMGKFAGQFKRFPLLLKFLDCNDVLSVQVHPSDDQKAYIPKGENGKTEAWMVLSTRQESLVYAGLKPGTTPQKLEQAIRDKTVGQYLHSFKPKVNDSVLIKAGTVHTLDGLLVFEVQENSDVTFRLYDWDRTDKKTGKPRELQVKEALACIDYSQIDIGPVEPDHDEPPEVLRSDHFIVWKHQKTDPFMAGKANEPRILVCTKGSGRLNSGQTVFEVTKGQVYLLPAQIGECSFEPSGDTALLEIGIPS